MKKTIYPILLSALCAFLFSSQAAAFVTDTDDNFLCVQNTADLTADLQAALGAVTSTIYDVRLIQDTFPIVNDPAGHFNVVVDHSLTISGGWNGDCSSQTEGPQLTVLQGGALQNDEGGVLRISISDNVSPATASISNLTLQNGNSTIDGGGLYVEHTHNGSANTATVNITNVIADSNHSETYGSGIAVFDYAIVGLTVNITDCIVRNNTAITGSEGEASGIFIDNFGQGNADIDVVISRCRILDNIANIDAGGIYIDTGLGNATLVNNVIAGNNADGNGGGISLKNVDGGSITLTNNTITGNTATGVTAFKDGGGIHADLGEKTSVLNIYNNILYGNAAAGEGDDLYIDNKDEDEDLYCAVNLYNNDLNLTETAGFFIQGQSNFSQGNNVDNIDPLFVDAANDDYHLAALSPDVSPLINWGSNVAPLVPSVDFDGISRPMNCTVDMGAYESQIEPGDVNVDGTVDIDDGVRIIQVLAGLTPADTVYLVSDVNCDLILGGEDASFVLQEISGLR